MKQNTKNKWVHVRVTKEQKMYLNQICKIMKKDRSRFVRSLINEAIVDIINPCFDPKE